MRILPSIFNLINEELKKILAEKYYDEVMQDLKDYLPVSKGYQERDYNISLTAFNFDGDKSKFGIEIVTTGFGKMFKISATNQRYKTTSLLIMSILLGYSLSNDRHITYLNFEDKREILNNDRLIQRFQNLKEVIFTKNPDRNEDKNICLKIIDDSENKILEITIDDEKIQVETSTDFKEFNINNASTYDGYLRYITSLNLFNLHLVSKGRNFVKYVLVEETKKYIESLELIKDRLRSKQIQWLGSNFVNKGEIKKQIDALKYIDKILEAKPKILEYYWKTEELKEIEKEWLLIRELCPRRREDISNDIKTIYDELIQIKKDIEQLLGAVEQKLDFNITGNINEKMVYFSKIFENDVLDRISINLKSPNRSLIPFSIQINGDIMGGRNNVTYQIKNTDQFFEAMQKINVSQNKYHNAYSEFIVNKSLIEELIKKKEKQETNINLLNNELQKSEKFYYYKEKYETLCNTIRSVDSMDKPTESQVLMLSKRIKESKVSDFDLLSIKELITDLESKMHAEVYDTSSLYDFVSDITDAYEIFGREVNLMSKGIVSQNFSLYIQKNNLLKKLIDVFSSDIKTRCGYFYRSESAARAKAYKIAKFDFLERAFYSEEGELLDLQNGLSGGTDSVMTVYSLASSVTSCKLGNILLVDEWGDVSSSFNRALIEKLKGLEMFAFAIFVDVDDTHDLIKMSVEGAE